MRHVGGEDSDAAYMIEGWFINGLPQGYGRKIESDGTLYNGKFRFGLENGEGERRIKRAGGEDTEASEVIEKGIFAFGTLQRPMN